MKYTFSSFHILTLEVSGTVFILLGLQQIANLSPIFPHPLSQHWSHNYKQAMYTPGTVLNTLRATSFYFGGYGAQMLWVV